jgi:hypothetical protein
MKCEPGRENRGKYPITNGIALSLFHQGHFHLEKRDSPAEYQAKPKTN